MYVDEVVKEREKPVNEDFEKNISKYIELVKEGKEVASSILENGKRTFKLTVKKLTIIISFEY